MTVPPTSDPPGFEVFSGPAAWAGPADDDQERARRKARQEAIEAIGPQRFTNRELSRLDFGARLLDLADDDRVPLLERVKFMAIFAEMLDEFFQVRVSGLEDQVAANVTTPSDDGLRPAEQLRAIRLRVVELVARQDRIFLDRLVPALAAAGIRLSARSSPPWPSTPRTRSPTSPTSRSTWWSRWATRSPGSGGSPGSRCRRC